MNHGELKKLVQLMNDNNLVELEVEREGSRVHLRKSGAYAQPPQAVAMPGMGLPGVSMPVPGLGAPPSTNASAPAPAPEAEPAPAEPDLAAIESPMVGTFYRKPSPDSDPYVRVGDHIDEETVVCIIEAMKVNNEIKAEIAGEVVEILVEDGNPVEFGQTLFRVKA